MSTPNQVFETLDEYMLPFNLRQCFDAFRFNTLYALEAMLSADSRERINACLQALVDSCGVDFNLGNVFDPYRERHTFIEALSPRTDISLPAIPYEIVVRFPDQPIAQLAEMECRRIKHLSDCLSDQEASSMAQLAAVAFGSFTVPDTRAAALLLVAANTSWKVTQYLRDHTGPWQDIRNEVAFPDMVQVQRDRILGVDITPAFTQEELECFSDEEIRDFGPSMQATFASLRCRHFMICPRCVTRLITWQSSLTDFLLPDEGNIPVLS